MRKTILAQMAATCLVASTFNAQSDVQIKSIVFFAGGGNFIPAEFWSTQRNSWRFSHARFREDLDASSSSRIF